MGAKPLGPTNDLARLDPQTYQIIGCGMEVHRVLGPGFLEAVYREAMRVEFAACQLPYPRVCNTNGSSSDSDIHHRISGCPLLPNL
jgi:GxxExxY protein